MLTFFKCYLSSAHAHLVLSVMSSSQDALDMGSARYKIVHFVLQSNFIFNSLNVGIGFKKPFYLLIYELLLLFHELMNQKQACLYLLKCISHGDSKYYGH